MAPQPETYGALPPTEVPGFPGSKCQCPVIPGSADLGERKAKTGSHGYMHLWPNLCSPLKF